MVTHTYSYTTEEQLGYALAACRDHAALEPNRESSLAITNLEQACLWWDAHRSAVGLDSLGLEWYRKGGSR